MGLYEFSKRIAELKYADIPAATVEKTRVAILNFLSGSLPGADSDLAYAEAAIWKEQNCSGNSVVIAHEGTTSALAAAAINAAMGQVFLQEDCHEHTISHPGVIVIPVALALGQSHHVSGEKLIEAVVCGYEVQGRIGKGLIRDGFPKNGLRPASILAPFGAAAAASKILGLDGEQTMNAISIAANAAGGMMEFSVTGTPEISIQNSNGAKNGMMAVLLASQGIKGAPTALDGRFGLGLALNNVACDWSALDESDTFEIDDTFVKIYPGCGHVLPTAQGIIDIVSSNQFDASDVKKVVVGASVNGGTFPGVDNPGPFHGTISAMMSHQYMVASAIIKGEVSIATIKQYDDEAINAFAPKVEITVDDEIETKNIIGARVTVYLKDGRKFVSFQDDTIPQTLYGIEERTRIFAKPFFDDARVDEILAKSKLIPQLSDINELMVLLKG
jgi:2-methylcitrate dehydratase PrpD